MNIRYRVDLNEAERNELTALLSGGKHAARKLKRAQILLAADAGASDETIANTVRVSGSTVYRTKRRFVEGNLELALKEEPRPGAARKLTGKETALLVATACSNPPEGRKRWTLDLLAEEMVKLTEHDELSRETVRRRLAEDDLKPWRKDMWCIPQVDGAYVARMEDVLDLYAEEADPKRPVVCFDESPTQLIGEVRLPIPAAPGQLERYDCEYRRNGTVNLFVFIDAHKSWRHVKVTDHRTAQDFAHFACAISSIRIIRMRTGYASCSTIFPPTAAAPCTKLSLRPRLIAFCSGSSSITRQSTPVGSTWLKSRSACCVANVWIDASATAIASFPKLPRGSSSEMPPARASNGSSTHRRPAKSLPGPIQTPPKSHNHCDEVLE
jgi:transposase